MKFNILLVFLISCLFQSFTQASTPSCVGFFLSRDSAFIHHALIESAGRAELKTNPQTRNEILKLTEFLVKKIQSNQLSEYQLEAIALNLIEKTKSPGNFKDRLIQYFKLSRTQDLERKNLKSLVFSKSLHEILSEYYPIQPKTFTEQSFLAIRRTNAKQATFELFLMGVYVKFFGASTYLLAALIPEYRFSTMRPQVNKAAEIALQHGLEAGLEHLKNSKIARYENLVINFKKYYYVFTLAVLVSVLPKDFKTYETIANVLNPFGESAETLRHRTGLHSAVETQLQAWREGIELTENREPSDAELAAEKAKITIQLQPFYSTR